MLLPSSPTLSSASSSFGSPVNESSKERPASPGPLLPPAPPPKAFKAYGQGYQYAENWQNPLPEFIVNSSYTHPTQVGVSPAATAGAAATAAGASAVDSGDGGYDNRRSTAHTHHESASSLHRSGTVGSKDTGIMQEAVWIEPEEAPWYKRITRQQWLVGGVTFLGILAVLLAILGAMGKLTGSDDAATSGAASSSSSTTTTTGGPTSTSTTALPQSTGDVKISCNDKSTFFPNINMVFTDKSQPDFSNATATAEECCAACFESDISCAGWQFDGTNKFTPCIRMFLEDGNANRDDKCPQGRAASTTFSGGGNKVAGMGPCSGRVIQG
ncbi:hypothetical protein QBC44DRAFT_147388 [Cladorrhinum sp. PSN332]|nr:hypothetical protein QBC44DRAFT_147388 [Cladorrhinum sp. PSN332]